MREVITRVFPDPAPAIIRIAPSFSRTAWCCAGLSDVVQNSLNWIIFSGFILSSSNSFYMPHKCSQKRDQGHFYIKKMSHGVNRGSALKGIASYFCCAPQGFSCKNSSRVSYTKTPASFIFCLASSVVALATPRLRSRINATL